ncbi:MAG: stage II sporulation protein P [Bacilli bacterium]|nr:stage II sporulation protein P [Bacilli bacterium]
MGRFKSKKRFNNLIIYIGLFIVSIGFSIKYLYQEKLINNNTLVDILINDNLENDKNNITDVDFLINYLLDVSLKPNNDFANKAEENTEKIEIDKNEIKVSEPLVYIYNTHQEEKYQSTYLKEYNISPTVLLASKILKEYLEDLGIGVIVEENNVADTLHSMNWKYGYSYRVSRMFMESAKENNPSLKYFIDLHRDSSKYDKTTTEINGEKYVRLLFVVGLDNKNYEPNLLLAEKLKEKIKKYNENLYRGIMKKSGAGVNGVYNQDFDSNVMLIEVGGQYNNISEVNNTLKVLANILAEYIKEDLNV